MNPSLDIHPTQRPANQAASAGRTPLRIASDELLRGERRLIIDHGESSYTLLLTRNGKLILTK
jgi:hemin uptake protein HemP